VTRGREIGVEERSGQREEFQDELKQAVVEQRDRMKRSIARRAKSVQRGKDVAPDIQTGGKRNESKESDCGRRRVG